MIIKIVPENDIEKQRFQEEEHTGVKDFFIFGVKRDKDEEIIDFHSWTGSYRNLIGGTAYYKDVLVAEMNAKSVSAKSPEIALRPQAKNISPLIKHGDGEIKEISTADELQNRVIPFPKANLSQNEEEMPSDEVKKNDSDLQAEDLT